MSTASFANSAGAKPAGDATRKTAASTLSEVYRFFCEFGILLDELEAQFRLLAHQLFEQAFGRLDVFARDVNLQQGAMARPHGGFLELRRHHFTQALEARHVHLGAG